MFTVTPGLRMLKPTLPRCLLAACLLLLCLRGAQAHEAAPKKVVVAAESWAHLLYLDAHDKPAGALADFVARMNAVQHQFRFELAIYPRLRLDQMFIDKLADVYPVRTVAWVGPELGLLPTATLLESGDLFFARKSNHFGGAAVFDAPATKMVAGVRGYHYQLFGNNADEAYINAHFKAYLLSSNEAVMQFVLADRADIGIMPEAIMVKYLQDPATRAEIIVGGYDSRVPLSNLVRKGGPISVAQMNAIVALLVKTGDVERLREQLTIAGQGAPK